MKGFGDTNNLLGKFNSNDIDADADADANQLLSNALNLHSKGNFKEAAIKYKLFLDRGFTDQRVLSNFGVICIQLGQKDNAIKLFKKSIQKYPNNSNAYSNLARLLSDCGKSDEAEKLFKKYIELNPNSYKGYYLLGFHFLKVNSINDAQKYFLLANSIQPKIPETNYQLGLTYKLLNEFNKSELFIRKSIELNPSFYSSYLVLAEILKVQGRYEESESTLRKLIDLKDDLPGPFINLAALLRELGQYDEAEVLINKAIELQPDSSEAHNNLSVILLDLERYEEAKLSSQKAISFNKDLAKAYLTQSIFKQPGVKEEWEDYLFSDQILENRSDIDRIDIFFARAKLLDADQNFSISQKYYKKANELNRKIYPSNFESTKAAIKKFILLTDKSECNTLSDEISCNPIFIVGLPRSGKTIIESILNSNDKLKKLSENIALEKSVNQYFRSNENDRKTTLYKLFLDNLPDKIPNDCYLSLTNPSNYIFTGFIINHIPNAKVIYCYRNPLDHAKAMFCKPLGSKYSFKSSVDETVKLCIYIDSIMNQYKEKYDSSIYFLNYDLLVTDPEMQIKKLLYWLGWDFEDKYLYPRLDMTTNIYKKENNSILDSHELFSWQNYQDMLKPAINIVKQEQKYDYLFH